MLAKLVPDIPPGALYEPKFDGFRAVIFRDGDEVELGSRNERPLTRYFPDVAGAATTSSVADRSGASSSTGTSSSRGPTREAPPHRRMRASVSAARRVAGTATRMPSRGSSSTASI